MDVIKATVCKALINLANKIEAGNCELDEEQAMNIMSVIGHEVISKDEACRHLNISRSKFDSLVADGKLPKGKKRRGFKELCWFRDELVIK